MKFGPVPVGEAQGAVLAHSVRLPGGKLGKGHLLTEADIATLAAAGEAEVWIARLEADDVGEDAAAEHMAAAILDGSSGLRAGAAGTGRVNLIAEGPGLLRVDAAAIHAANRTDPAITIATLPPYARLGAGGLAVTVKIIPFAAPWAHLAEAGAAARGAVSLIAPTIRTASLIETRTGSAMPSEKGRRATADRLARLGVALSDRIVVPHTIADIAEALAAAPGELLLILTGSATSDIADTAPAAVVRAGGQVVHYGMPVDPGNLLFLGAVGPRAVIGLPGCARSPALNGADWVLERVICGLSVTPEDIMAMGVGGLLKEIPERGHPRRRYPLPKG